MVIKSHLSKRKLTWNQKKHLTGLLFLLPQSAFLAVFIVYPLASVIFYSLFDWNGMSQMKFVGADNYKLLPGTEGFWDMAKATVIYAVGVTGLVVLCGFLVALALDKRGKWRLNRTAMGFFWFFPCLLSGAIVGIIWRIMFNYNGGLVNFLLNRMGIKSVNWLETYGVTMAAVIIASVWSQIGMCAIIFLAGLQNIPTDMLEAADLDGASDIQKKAMIVIPLMAPSITINVITTSIAAFKAYELPYTVSKGLPGYSTRILTQRIYFYSFNTNKYGIASAMSILLVIVITLISLLQLFVLKKREDIY